MEAMCSRASCGLQHKLLLEMFQAFWPGCLTAVEGTECCQGGVGIVPSMCCLYEIEHGSDPLKFMQ